MLQIDKALGAKIFSSFGRFELQKRLLERSFGATEMPNEGELFARPKLENAKRQLGLYKGGPASCNRYKRDPGASLRGSLFDLAQGQPGADISAARGLKYRLI